MDLKKLKDVELEKYFQALFSMYPTDGWRMIAEDMGRLKELYNQVGDVETVEELWFRRGQLDVINQILTLTASLMAERVLVKIGARGVATDGAPQVFFLQSP